MIKSSKSIWLSKRQIDVEDFVNFYDLLWIWKVIWLKLNRMKWKLQDRFSNGILWQFFGIWMSISTSISRKDKLKYYNFAHCASAASSKGNHLGHALNGKVIWELWHSSSFSKEKTSPPFEAFHNGLNSFLKNFKKYFETLPSILYSEFGPKTIKNGVQKSNYILYIQTWAVFEKQPAFQTAVEAA